MPSHLIHGCDMGFRAAFLLLFTISSLSGCGKPVPPEKAAYVGEWQDKLMYLLITQDGSVVYKRLEAGVSKSIEGPLKGFHGDSFDVGVGPISTEFKVSVPPHKEGEAWKMVVDGVELTKTDQ
jgi:hypothetical protein